MKDIQAYIDSGVLELYVYGTLPEREMLEVSRLVAKHPELLIEVERIEAAVQKLSASVGHKNTLDYSNIQSRIHKDKNVIPLSRKRARPLSYLGWAAAVLLIAGVGYLYNENKKLEEQITDTQRENILWERKTQIAEESLNNTNKLLDAIRNKDIVKITLGAQAVAPEAYASVYWDKKSQKTYIDVSGLPQPPSGKVYQVWSLMLDPLTPTSIGIIDTYDKNGNQLFELANPNESQAFGITLEPEGGSNSPTLEQLYTLGIVTP